MADASLSAPELRANEIVFSAILAAWAIGLGIYLTAGGVQGLTSVAYGPLMKLVHHDYHIIGITMLVAGVANLVAMVSRQRRCVAYASLLCALWCATVAYCMGIAMFTLPGGGNMNTWSMGLISIVFAMRFINYRRARPTGDGTSVLL